MSKPKPSARRTFLKAGAAAAALATYRAQTSLAASEKLNIGIIGTGGKGQSLMREAIKQGQNIVALCDVAGFRIDQASEFVRKSGQVKPAEYGDHRKLLEHPSLDAVIIATPDHWHHDCLIDAMAAKKDTYIEKPLSRSIEEGKAMVAAVRKTQAIVQVGNQRHSGEHWARCRDVIQSRDFGDLVWVKVWDCRNWVRRDPFAPPPKFNAAASRIDWKRFLGKAPNRPFDAHRYFAWRWFWDYAGGLMTDIGAHQLDIVQWLGNAEKGPKSVSCNGGNHYFKYWQTPDVVHGIFDYGKFTATFGVEFINGYDGVGATFYGTKKTLWADAEKEIRVYDTIDQPSADQKPSARWPVTYEGPAHMANWLACCKSRKQPNSTIELGHRVITTAHLANISYRTGRRVYWDGNREVPAPKA